MIDTTKPAEHMPYGTKEAWNEAYWKARRNDSEQAYSREELEGFVAGMTLKQEQLDWQISKLTAQRDELLMACEAALADYEGPIAMLTKMAKVHPYTIVPAMLREAIANAKGTTNG